MNTNLYSEYENILSIERQWNPLKNQKFTDELGDDLLNVFNAPHTYNFIFKLLFWDGNYGSLTGMLNSWKDKIPQQRFKHTVSLYLLGIICAKRIGFNAFDFPKWDNDADRNFLHHWAAICLFHDIGYFIEEDKTDFPLNEYKDLDAICERFHIDHNLRDEDESNLINRYYQYRIDKGCIDHGIVAAMLLYDRMMKRNEKYEEFERQGGTINSEKPLYGMENINNIILYSKSIARHNMWYAKPNSDEEKDYEKYELQELMLSLSPTEKISFSNNPAIFLLCLLDTLEPLKKYSGDDTEKVLKNTSFEVQKDDDNISVLIIEQEEDKLVKGTGALQDWMDVKVKKDSNNSVRICFSTK